MKLADQTSPTWQAVEYPSYLSSNPAFSLTAADELTVAGAATVGFMSGAVATGSLKGAIQGAFTAGTFYGAGEIIQGAELAQRSWQAVQVMMCV